METRRAEIWIIALLLLVVAARLLTMAALPVIDTTESRYAEITRLMLESGNWLMPQAEPGIPFWGKPPLFAWLSAASASLLGESEFAMRLPHFIMTLLAFALLIPLCGSINSGKSPWLALLILASLPLVFVISGTVMTDAGLLLCVVMSMSGFWLCAVDNRRKQGLLFFAGLGLGMLAKGPVIPVMILAPIAAWLTWNAQWRRLRTLPWVPGLALCLALFLPWYVAAERASPGFLHYFLVGEHFLRFVQPGWEGDLYGNPHSELPGMIWLLWFQATAAWGLIFAIWLVRGKLAPGMDSGPRAGARSYLLCWLLTPLVFFTFSGNILWTYVLSGMPALAILVAGLAGRDRDHFLASRALITVATLLVPAAALAYTFMSPRGYFVLSERELVREFEATRVSAEEPLVYLDYRPQSALFYTGRQAGLSDAGPGDYRGKSVWLAVHKTDGTPPPWDCKLRFRPQTGLFDLYRCQP